MIPSLLITLREVIEASLIVATILGILTKLGHTKSIKTVWMATAAAALLSLVLLAAGSLIGLKVQELYTGAVEEAVEGTLMILSAVFITWAVFFLHNYFGRYKTTLLQKLQTTVTRNEAPALFVLVFTAVFREGFEIVLFLSTIYFSSSPQQILGGFSLGAILGLAISFGLFTATLRLPVFWAFRTTSMLLILFAAGLLARGVHEFAEVGVIPEAAAVTLAFIPHSASFAGGIIKSIFGVTQKMDVVQLFLYAAYTLGMSWWVFFRPSEGVLTPRSSVGHLRRSSQAPEEQG
jgi:high-affinity iron transporter